MKLFSYQENAILAIESDPSHSQLISMPTGTGKTITFLSAAKKKAKKCLVLVHRKELLEQTLEKAKLIGFLDHEVSVICSEEKQSLKNLSVAMVPTLIRNLSRYNPNDVEMMIIDEAHHATADSYKRILKYFNVFEEKKTLLGFTATPLRGDNECLSGIFSSHSFKLTLSEATKNGYICPVHGIRVDIKRSLEQIEMLGNDYNPEQLERIMNCESINNLIANRCEHLTRVPAVIFCTSVDHAEKIKNGIISKGRTCECVSYKTPEKESERIISEFKNGKLDFITNAIKLSEGFDHPAIQSVILARPTRSPVLYKQMIGRGLRKYPGKSECFVLEFSGNDPKMICWEDIDENCTFQSTSLKEKQDQTQARNYYSSKFKGPNVKILDVRLSPFKFYECRTRRMGKIANFRYIPDDMGFVVAEFRGIPTPTGFDSNLRGAFCFAWTCFWKEQYQSFYVWDGYGPLYHHGSSQGWHHDELERQIMHFAERNGTARWYPSEEEPMSHSQKKLLTNPEKMNARKAEMFIEDCAVKRAINTYWRSAKMPLVDGDIPAAAHDEGMISTKSILHSIYQKENSYPIYTLPGKY